MAADRSVSEVVSGGSRQSVSQGRTVSVAEWLRRPPRERKTRGSNPAFSVGSFPGRVIPCSDLEICTPVATLPGA